MEVFIRKPFTFINDANSLKSFLINNIITKIMVSNLTKNIKLKLSQNAYKIEVYLN
ncbi:hypothetical protein CPJCM30710_00850 [Clostridium polyendosporum]|uniref:Uncharacterized protein n=1 Tax=Clostridium polyendosporum TaxID=69208 RepID=A0A919VCX8_9CLOT|nr:hypothetical protein CPJCM30710_00850 [Clostridium polyendosporum]